ncbi:MAG: hypothetical protein HYU66_20105 [Armatimonadetes bacterium]|nr:hypothetical protein [Armatimonadota bacterium]
MTALLAGLPAKAEKEPAVAGLLGIVPGFGTGYWYAGHHNGKALTFTLLDIGLTAGGIGVFTKDFGDAVASSFWLGTPLEGDVTLAGIMMLARIGSGIFQCVDGIGTVNHDNKRGRGFADRGRQPRFGLSMGFTDFSGVPGLGGPSMSFARRYEFGELALSHSRALAAQPSVMLHVNAADLGAGLSFHQQF